MERSRSIAIMETLEYTSHRPQLAQRIAAIRASQHLSGRKFALMIGISRSYLHRLETADASPTFDMLERIAAGLGIPVEKLVTFDDSNDGLTSSEYQDMGHQRQSQNAR